MINFLLATAISTTTCSVSIYEQAIHTNSAHLQEEAEASGKSELELGAYLMLWNETACFELADDEGEISETRRIKLEKKCVKVIRLDKTDEAGYVSASQAYVSQSSADFVTLVWAVPGERPESVIHSAYLANRKDALRYDFPGYGRTGEPEMQCIASPWTFPARHGG